jgi:hypothetical protein
MSSFPLRVVASVEDGTHVLPFPVSSVAGEVAAKAGELMFYDAVTDLQLERCGADPALILGVCEGSSEAMKVLTADGRIPLRVLTPKALVEMCSTTVPAQAHIGVLYGIARDANGNWAVDIGDTSNTRVIVVEIDIGRGAFYVHFIAANLQGDAIAS